MASEKTIASIDKNSFGALLPEGLGQAYLNAFGVTAIFVATLDCPPYVGGYHGEASSCCHIGVARDLRRAWKALCGTTPNAQLVSVFWTSSRRGADRVASAAVVELVPDRETTEWLRIGAPDAMRAIAEAALRLAVPLTDHEAVMARATAAAMRLGEATCEAQAEGTLARFNERYRYERLAAKAAGRGFISYGRAVAALQRAILLQAAGASDGDRGDCPTRQRRELRDYDRDCREADTAGTAPGDLAAHWWGDGLPR